VEGYVQLMKDRYGKLSEEDYNHMLSRSLERTGAMRKLIFDLLDLTRIESGEKKRNLVSCQLKQEINKAIDLLSLEATKKNIQILFDFDSGEEASWDMMADISELEIVFNNLISNGIKYNKDNGTLLIKLSHLMSDQQNAYQISFKDSGIGIKDEDLQRLFQDFIRIKNEHTLKISGSGLGLSTVKKISQLYGGDVSVESRYGAGSTFTIILPKEARNR
jgi:signal transduction histidine kinase